MEPPKKMSVFGANFLIFLGYYILAVILSHVADGGLGVTVIFGGYVVHAAVLILMSVVLGIGGVMRKEKTNASQYLLMGILLLIVGFGACTVALTGGFVPFNI
jgi:hypothetical protein